MLLVSASPSLSLFLSVFRSFGQFFLVICFFYVHDGNDDNAEEKRGLANETTPTLRISYTKAPQSLLLSFFARVLYVLVCIDILIYIYLYMYICFNLMCPHPNYVYVRVSVCGLVLDILSRWNCVQYEKDKTRMQIKVLKALEDKAKAKNKYNRCSWGIL